MLVRLGNASCPHANLSFLRNYHLYGTAQSDACHSFVAPITSGASGYRKGPGRAVRRAAPAGERPFMSRANSLSRLYESVSFQNRWRKKVRGK